MKKFFLLYLILLGLGCVARAQSPKPYSVKSGKMTQVTAPMGQEITAQIYFDDYGDRVATILQNPINGSTIRTLKQDGRYFAIDPEAGTYMEIPPQQQEEINFLDLSEETIQKYKIKILGFDEVDGKSCLIYEMTLEQSGSRVSAKAWVWEGITLRMEVRIMGMSITTVMKDIEVDIDIDPEVFALPE